MHTYPCMHWILYDVWLSKALSRLYHLPEVVKLQYPMQRKSECSRTIRLYRNFSCSIAFNVLSAWRYRFGETWLLEPIAPILGIGTL